MKHDEISAFLDEALESDSVLVQLTHIIYDQHTSGMSARGIAKNVLRKLKEIMLDSPKSEGLS